MADRKSLASALIFAGSLLCFFFPFVAISCGGVEAFTLTGQQLATGTSISQPQPFGPPQKQHIDPDPFAAIAGLGYSCLFQRLYGTPFTVTAYMSAVVPGFTVLSTLSCSSLI